MSNADADLPAALAAFVQAELSAHRDPDKAAQMAAYLKTDMPFYGVQRGLRKEVEKAAKKRFKPRDASEYEAAVVALWVLPQREEKQLAIEYARMWPRFIAPPALGLYERMVREGAWWDLVDGTAVWLVGKVLAKHRAEVFELLDRWIEDDDMWIRRTAILAQLKLKAETDEERLFDYCRRRAAEKEFFIRKAIGWALREYAKTAPERVRDFLVAHRDELSGLSYREAARSLVKAGLL